LMPQKPKFCNRVSRATGPPRDQVLVTTSGQFTYPPLAVLLGTFGIDNVMYSVDYPNSPNDRGKAFLAQLLSVPSDVEKIAHGNADRLLRLG
jgi:predicted TIM-barrel fold metal-dependent hydrolase